MRKCRVSKLNHFTPTLFRSSCDSIFSSDNQIPQIANCLHFYDHFYSELPSLLNSQSRLSWCVLTIHNPNCEAWPFCLISQSWWEVCMFRVGTFRKFYQRLWEEWGIKFKTTQANASLNIKHPWSPRIFNPCILSRHLVLASSNLSHHPLYLICSFLFHP